MSQLLRQLNNEMSAVVDDARRSLVQVRNGRSGAGAGTILHPDGLIITNAHVTRRRSPEVTLWDGRKLPARLLAYDEDTDLAAIAVEAHDLPTIELGNGRGQAHSERQTFPQKGPWLRGRGFRLGKHSFRPPSTRNR